MLTLIKYCTFTFIMGHQYFFQDFDSNFNQNSIVNTTLDPNIYARYIRIVPLTWYNHISLRMEIIGCTQSEKDYCEY